ncbi:hypothetical protein BST36_23095 [Mycolicibacterium moriokaense]|uniref:IclR family transcriptional regulator n=2 Tax=Mycolicibacterium moriokaense TaxID=39691 RepID=A0AAD1HHT5_9MYCO|nr:IclR family transcriptional regulator [Mycolicibacterium moriokaense]MCV7042187.1 IclR family transcriptional regulator [Mycolicibacterium moriokaense]ORB19035.1 hypothetical protein BST36_23095 [Mycolicibacterium moriokaense]BBX04959.1 IclR family transcriptional regulator [Mycolicibacterium moriokaense]
MLLDLIAAAPEPMGSSELAQITGLPKSTVFRLARQLVMLGALRQGKGGYQIGLTLFEIGNRHYPSDVKEAVQPYLADLCRATGLTVQAGLLDGADVAYLERHVPRHGVATVRRTDFRVPARRSAAGRVLLAALSPRKLTALLGDADAQPRGLTARDQRLLTQLHQVRQDGYALEQGEIDPALASVAVPIPVPGSRVVHSALELRGSRETLRPDQVLSAARITASAIARVASRAQARPR